jgi:hypothetical protein
VTIMISVTVACNLVIVAVIVCVPVVPTVFGEFARGVERTTSGSLCL